MKASAGDGKRALVTGGVGFIGSHLCRRLLDDGFSVTCLDNLSSGNIENVKDLDIDFIERDTREPLELETDYVFHLASLASPVDFAGHAVDILLGNSLGTYNVLQLAHRNGARFLLASTSEVYGNPREHPQKENYWGNVNPVGVRACYDEGKRFAEALSMSFHRSHRLDVRIARIFNTYGEQMRRDDGRVVSNFVNQALEGRPLTVYGDGTQTRSFCHVADMVEGLMKLMFTSDIAGEVVNIGNPHEVTVNEIARMIKEMTESESHIVFKSLPQDDPVKRRPDITKAMEILDWKPVVILEEGLGRTIDYFREQHRESSVCQSADV